MSPFARILSRLLRESETPTGRAREEDAVVAFESRALSSLYAALAREDAFPWAAELGVAWPCSPEELRRAFRRRAFEAHPDRPGGSHEAFLRLQASLERAIAEGAKAPRVRSAALRYDTRHVSPAPRATTPAYG